MALDKNTLKTAIEAAFTAQMNKTENREAALADLADKTATAIDAFVKSGTVTVASGIPVSTAGSATAQTGATTGTGTGTIS
jgi:hypothetical protein